jgi:Gas vesicle protein G
MGLIADLLLFPVTGPVRGFQFVLERIRAEADAQLLDEGRVQAELLNCSLRYDAGEISEQEYLQQEAELLDLLDEIRAYKEGTDEDDTEAT